MKSLTALIAVLSLSLVGCEETTSDSLTLNDVGNDIRDAAKTTAEYARDKTDAILGEISSGFDTFQDRVQSLNDRAKEGLSNASDSVRSTWEETRAALSEKQSTFAKAYEEFKNRGSEASEEMREGVVEAWSELQSAYDDAASRLEGLQKRVTSG